MDKQVYLILPEDIRDDEKYFLISGNYCFVYTDNPPKRREWLETETLPSIAKNWLADCIVEEARERLVQAEHEQLVQAKMFINKFRENIEKAKGGEESGN